MEKKLEEIKKRHQERFEKTASKYAKEVRKKVLENMQQLVDDLTKDEK